MPDTYSFSSEDHIYDVGVSASKASQKHSSPFLKNIQQVFYIVFLLTISPNTNEAHISFYEDKYGIFEYVWAQENLIIRRNIASKHNSRSQHQKGSDVLHW